MCQDLVLGVGDRVKIVMWSKASTYHGACSIPCKTYTRSVGLAWQLDVFSEMCLGRELGLDTEVRVLTLAFKYLLILAKSQLPHL